MDTDATSQRRDLITIAMLTEPTGVLPGDRNEVFHRDLPSKKNITVREKKLPLQSIGFS
jgi:hypothetical protein